MNGSDGETLADLVADRQALDVAADLTVTIEGHELQVESYTDRLFIDIPSTRAAVAAVRRLPGDGPGRRAASRLLTAGRLLTAADLTVVIRIAGAEVARLGADLKGIEYGSLAIRPTGLLRALVG